MNYVEAQLWSKVFVEPNNMGLMRTWYNSPGTFARVSWVRCWSGGIVLCFGCTFLLLLFVRLGLFCCCWFLVGFFVFSLLVVVFFSRFFSVLPTICWTFIEVSNRGKVSYSKTQPWLLPPSLFDHTSSFPSRMSHVVNIFVVLAYLLRVILWCDQLWVQSTRTAIVGPHPTEAKCCAKEGRNKYLGH